MSVIHCSDIDEHNVVAGAGPCLHLCQVVLRDDQRLLQRRWQGVPKVNMIENTGSAISTFGELMEFTALTVNR